MVYEKIQCPKCGRNIGKNNYSRHYNKCNPSVTEVVYSLDHDGLYCKFCDKLCKNKNSLVQHELRCKNNPNRKDFDKLAKFSETVLKGQTKYTNSSIMRQSISLREKYKDGYVSPNLGKRRTYKSIYSEHNLMEISKWLNYVSMLDVVIPEHDIILGKSSKNYAIVSTKYEFRGKDFVIFFEHDLIANIYLGGNLSKNNTVHHIDENIRNNDINNLIVFETNGEHKRFHNSKYAWLVYNESTHLFNCILKK